MEDFLTLALDPITMEGEDGIPIAMEAVQTEMRKRKPTKKRISVIEAICDILVPALGIGTAVRFPGELPDPSSPRGRGRLPIPSGRGRLAVALIAVSGVCSLEALVRGRERLKPEDLPGITNVTDAFKQFKQLTEE